MDDTFAYVLPDKIDMILHELHQYYPNIKFTYQLESNNKLAFLDVSARRTNDNKVETSVYRKATCTNIYINKLALTCPIKLENWYPEKSYKKNKIYKFL